MLKHVWCFLRSLCKLLLLLKKKFWNIMEYHSIYSIFIGFSANYHTSRVKRMKWFHSIFFQLLSRKNWYQIKGQLQIPALKYTTLVLLSMGNNRVCLDHGCKKQVRRREDLNSSFVTFLHRTIQKHH